MFAEKDLEVIMADYKAFLVIFFKESDKVLLASRAVLAQVVALFGGESAWWRFVNNNNLSFFSDSTDENTIVTTCHPEFLTNTWYRNWYSTMLGFMTGFTRRSGDSWVTVMITYALLVVTSSRRMEDPLHASSLSG